MPIHQNYARLNAADRAVIDEAFSAATEVFKHARRRFDNADHAERAVEALATYMIASDGVARVGDGENHTAPVGVRHRSYGQ